MEGAAVMRNSLSGDMVYPQRFASGSLKLARGKDVPPLPRLKLKALEAPKPTLNAFALNSFLPQDQSQAARLTGNLRPLSIPC